MWLTTGPGYNKLRRCRFSERGRPYLVTTTTKDRRPLFEDFDAAHVVARCHLDRGLFLDARILCWLLMPDHWHGIIELADAPIERVVNRFKSATSHAVKPTLGGPAAVWERGFHDRAVRAEEDLVAMARYVVMNPVRAGLVARVGDYPFWDAVWL